MLRKLATGFVFAAALIAVYLIILFGSAFVPGSPMNEVSKRAETMAHDPTDAQIKAWFEDAKAVSIFGSIVVPAIVVLLAGALRLRGFPSSTAAWVLAMLSWFAFYFVFVGTGALEIVVSVVSLVLFGMFEYIAQKRVAGAIAA